MSPFETINRLSWKIEILREAYKNTSDKETKDYIADWGKILVQHRDLLEKHLQQAQDKVIKMQHRASS